MSDVQTRSASWPVPMLGLLQMHPSHYFIDQAGAVGFHFLMFDCEHGSFDRMSLEAAIKRAKEVGVRSFVRISSCDAAEVRDCRELEPNAIVIPHVERSSDLAAIAAQLAGDNAPQLIAIIESATGVENITDILNVFGLDAVIIGISDLSSDLGHSGQFDHPVFVAAFEKIERAAALQGIRFGTVPHGSTSASALMRRGHTIIIAGVDVTVISEGLTREMTSLAPHLACGHGRPERADG